MIALWLLRIRPVIKLPNFFVVSLLILLVGGWVWVVFLLPCHTYKSSGVAMEVKQYISLMNRAQQTHYLENGQFGVSLDELGLTIQPVTEKFVYSVQSTANAAFQYGTTRPDCRTCRLFLSDVVSFSRTKCHNGPCLQRVSCRSKSYAGVVYTERTGEQVQTRSVLCRAKAPGTVQLNPTYRNGVVDCGFNAEKIE